jgi:hypothetical protein
MAAAKKRLKFDLIMFLFTSDGGRASADAPKKQSMFAE